MLRPNTAMKLASAMDGRITERLALIREDWRDMLAWPVTALAAYGQSR